MLVAVRFRATDDEDEEGRALIDTEEKAAEEAPTPVDELPDSIRDRI